jgi:hypothetical protein
MAAYEFLYTEDIYTINDSILIVVDKPWEEIAEEEKILLTKILGSVKLSLDKVQVVYHQDVSLASLAVYQASKIIAFGIVLSSAHEAYQYHITENTSFIQCDALNMLNDVTKKSLWLALKQAFLS